PYAAWVAGQRVDLDALPAPDAPQPREAAPLLARQAAFGYTGEEVRMILAPMAAGGEEAVGSMGTDTPLAVLSDRPQLLFRYFKQLFAQVTNPPIDPIREAMVMSLGIHLGPRANLLEESPGHARRVRLRQPVLSDADAAKLRSLGDPFRACVLSTPFPAREGAEGLSRAL